MSKSKSSLSPTTVNLLVDGSIFTGFLVAMAPRFSGLAVHEWLGIAFAAAITVHLLLHWDWIVNVTRRIFNAALRRKQRINYALNLLLFIDFVVISLSGILISEAALPALGIRLQQGFAWRGIHTLSANLALLILGLHIAMHWQWITKNFARTVFSPLAARMRPARSTTATPGAQS